ncbi:hypothetical protein N7530_003765 [Penicillium desertorum]|uniref:Uncharacterized protein n=1 Tax=Penicillium desertorum TaxID=1303715 RepID=A0A9W9WX18_9EURO|nr:hypothetical protein N7530_003765 [Penicillium desertorum]
MPSIYDFDRQNESNISKIVPKLKGESNFAQWQHRLYIALKENNKIYIEIIQGIVQKPSPPDLYDKSPEVIRELAQHRATSSSNKATVSDTVIRELVKEQKHKNAKILERHQVLLDK